MLAVLIDLILLGGLVLGGVLGYRTGVLKRIFHILIILSALCVIAIFLPSVGSFFRDALSSSEATATVIAIIVLASLTAVPAMTLYHWFDKDFSGNEASRFFGAALGVLESAVLMGIILVLLNVSHFPDDDTRSDSLLYKPVARFAPWTFALFTPMLPHGKELRANLSRIFQDNSVSKRIVDGKEKL
jgi:membrane protein required for colicin V production